MYLLRIDSKWYYDHDLLTFRYMAHNSRIYMHKEGITRGPHEASSIIVDGAGRSVYLSPEIAV